MSILLLDDERDFRDGRDCFTARTVAEAIEFTDSMDELDELWLDFILVSDDTTSFVKHLMTRMREGRPLKVNRVFFHSSAWDAIGLINVWGEKAGLPKAEFPDGPISKKLIG